MATYDVTLRFALPKQGGDTSQLLDALFEAGCADATPGVGNPGQVSLIFSREAESEEAAVRAAVNNVLAVLPGARLVESRHKSSIDFSY